MKKNTKRKFNNFKKSLKNFIKDEEGFVSKENILKIGLGTISALGILGSFSNTFAGHTSHASHNNMNYLTQDWVTPNCYRIAVAHTSHPSHTSHGSY